MNKLINYFHSKRHAAGLLKIRKRKYTQNDAYFKNMAYILIFCFYGITTRKPATGHCPEFVCRCKNLKNSQPVSLTSTSVTHFLNFQLVCIFKGIQTQYILACRAVSRQRSQTNRFPQQQSARNNRSTVGKGVF
jgi:hypothetical protein